MPRRSDLGQGEVPQRLPLPDEDLGRRRRDRLARRRGGDHLAEGAAQMLVRAVRAHHEEDLLGGVVPHPPRPRRRADAHERHRRATGIGAGSSRPLVGAADAVPRQPDREGRGPDVRLADQVAGERGGAAAVPRRLRPADLGARPERARPEAAQVGRRSVGVHRTRLGRAAQRRHRPRTEVAGPARPQAPRARELGVGPAGRARRSGLIYEVFRQERKGQPFQHAGSLEAANHDFAEAYAKEFYGRRGESEALWVVPREAIIEVEDFVDELILGWRDSEWTGIAPFLEEDVAFSSIAQNEIGHARALYELVARELDTSADELALDRAPYEYRCAPLVELRLMDWEKTIARHYLYETADAIRLAALKDSDDAEV